MPDWDVIYTYSTTPAGFWEADDGTVTHVYSASDYTQRMWEEHLEKERQEEIKRKQRAEDKVKYPLFFLKEGIV